MEAGTSNIVSGIGEALAVVPERVARKVVLWRTQTDVKPKVARN